MFILLISNHTVFLVQFGINLQLWVSCNFSFLKNSLVQINSKLNSKPYDYLYIFSSLHDSVLKIKLLLVVIAILSDHWHVSVEFLFYHKLSHHVSFSKWWPIRGGPLSLQELTNPNELVVELVDLTLIRHKFNEVLPGGGALSRCSDREVRPGCLTPDPV